MITELTQMILPGLVSMDGALASDIIQMILHAGPVVKFVMLILFLFSITSWAIIFMKWRLVRKAREETSYFLESFWESTDMTKIFIPIGGIIVGALLVSVLIQFLGRKKKPLNPDVPRDYGMLGGTICPKCGHPFPRSLFGMNLLVGRLERCESCGKFSLTTRATPEEIYRAEQAERAAEKAAGEAAKVAPKKEDTADKLDDSKYIDSI